MFYYSLHFIDKKAKAQNGDQDHTARTWIWIQQSAVCALSQILPLLLIHFLFSFFQVLLHLASFLFSSACDICSQRLFSLALRASAIMGSCFSQGQGRSILCCLGCPCEWFHVYFQIRSRVDVIRHVVKNGLLWDELYIGFQTRLQRDPDIYHHL